MKALSLRQPFAELLAIGKKTIELRKWNTKFRGKFLIHASLKPDLGACKELGIAPEKLDYGKVIGEAELYEVKIYKNKEEFMQDKRRHLASNSFLSSKYGFLVKNARKVKPISLKGQLNFFNTDIIP